MKTIVEVELDIPENWKFVAHRVPKAGEYVTLVNYSQPLMVHSDANGKLFTICQGQVIDCQCSRRFIVERVKRYRKPTLADIGKPVQVYDPSKPPSTRINPILVSVLSTGFVVEISGEHHLYDLSHVRILDEPSSCPPPEKDCCKKATNGCGPCGDMHYLPH
jgi:hypothetical protein